MAGGSPLPENPLIGMEDLSATDGTSTLAAQKQSVINCAGPSAPTEAEKMEVAGEVSMENSMVLVISSEDQDVLKNFWVSTQDLEEQDKEDKEIAEITPPETREETVAENTANTDTMAETTEPEAAGSVSAEAPAVAATIEPTTEPTASTQQAENVEEATLEATTIEPPAAEAEQTDVAPVATTEQEQPVTEEAPPAPPAPEPTPIRSEIVFRRICATCSNHSWRKNCYAQYCIACSTRFAVMYEDEITNEELRAAITEEERPACNPGDDESAYCKDCLLNWIDNCIVWPHREPLPKTDGHSMLPIVEPFVSKGYMERLKAAQAYWDDEDKIFCPVQTCSTYVPRETYTLIKEVEVITPAPKEEKKEETPVSAEETQTAVVDTPAPATTEETQATAVETPAIAEETQTAVVDTPTPATTEETQASAVETPATSEEAQSAVVETPATAEETQVTIVETPATAEETQATTEETPATAEETQTTAAETPATTEETQVNTEETQITTEESQTTVEETQTPARDAQAISEEIQDTVEEALTTTEDTQTTIEGTQAATEEAQTTAEGAQAATEETPTEEIRAAPEVTYITFEETLAPFEETPPPSAGGQTKEKEPDTVVKMVKKELKSHLAVCPSAACRTPICTLCKSHFHGIDTPCDSRTNFFKSFLLSKYANPGGETAPQGGEGEAVEDDEDGDEYEEYPNRFRQCVNCQNLVARHTGCDHMTCACGYMFCFYCGGEYGQYHDCITEDDYNEGKGVGGIKITNEDGFLHEGANVVVNKAGVLEREEDLMKMERLLEVALAEFTDGVLTKKVWRARPGVEMDIPRQGNRKYALSEQEIERFKDRRDGALTADML